MVISGSLIIKQRLFSANIAQKPHLMTLMWKEKAFIHGVWLIFFKH